MDKMKGYRQFLKELPSKKIVFAFGRFNPPTIGHELLVKAVKKIAVGSDHTVFVSRSQDSKRNPLPVNRKVYYLKRMFPGIKFGAASDDMRTVIEVVKHLNKQYKNIVMVAGSDRVVEFKKLLERYNGKEYKFDSIQVISAGERDPDGDSASGMSATKMRDAAKKGDFNSFKRGVPQTLTHLDTRRLMNEVRAGMGLEKIKESVNFHRDTIREQYFSGDIFNIGDLVESNGIKYEIIKRGSNHLLLKSPDGSLLSKWLQDVNLVEDIQIGPAKPEITFKNYTTKNLHHSADASKAFEMTIKRLGDIYPEQVLTALKATDKYMKINDLHLEQDGKAPDPQEVNDWINYHEQAKTNLEKIGDFMHHMDYWHMHLHELEYLLINYKETGKDEMREEKSFSDPKKDKESGLPKKYVSGLSPSTAKARAVHWKRANKLSDKDPEAYKPAPGDKTAETKPSKYTKKYKELYGENMEALKFTASDKIKIARVIATSLGVDDAQKKSNPEQLVNLGLRMVRKYTMSRNGYKILLNMLKTAKMAGIKYDEKLIPVQASVVKDVKVDEAVSPAQQAAIAIAMKKAGKTPKNEEQIEENTAVRNKSEKSGVSYGTLMKVYKRGVAAWNSGHRPGTTPEQWGLARVNSYITKGKTYHTADKDLREEEINEISKDAANRYMWSAISDRRERDKKISDAQKKQDKKFSNTRFKNISKMYDKNDKRTAGIGRALNKLSQEDTSGLNEAIIQPDGTTRVGQYNSPVVDTSSDYNIAKSIMRYSDMMRLLGKKPIEKIKSAYQDEDWEFAPEMPDPEHTEVGSTLDTPDDDHLRRRKVQYHLGEEIKDADKQVKLKADDKSLGAEYAKGFDAFFEEEDDEEMSDEKMDKIAQDVADNITDDDIINHGYDDEDFTEIDDETAEKLEDDDEVNEEAISEVLSRVERIRAKQRLTRTKSKRERARKIALNKFSSTNVLRNRARRLAVKALKQRFTKGRDLKKISVAEKERLEARIKKLTPIVGRITLRMIPRVRQLEKSRLSHKRFTK